MNELRAPQNWQEHEGDILPPEVEPTISGQQPYINRAELWEDHAEISGDAAQVVEASTEVKAADSPVVALEATPVRVTVPAKESNVLKVLRYPDYSNTEQQ